MRSHASAAHPTDHQVEGAEVLALAALLEVSLFNLAIPEPGHSVAGIFEPIKGNLLDEDQIAIFSDQINGCNPQDLRTAYGFLLEKLCEGDENSSENSKLLMPIAWNRATEDLKKAAGLRYHTYDVDPSGQPTR
jgi:hypothetical protein